MMNLLVHSIVKFSQTRLPQYRQVLQRYRSIRSANHNMLLNDVAQVITNELIELWKLTRIPYITMNAINKPVIRLINQWKKPKVESSVSPKEQSKLNKLFDLRPSNLLTEESLKNYLMKYSYLSWSEELGFVVGQLNHNPQTSSITSTTDHVQGLVDQEKEKIAAKAEIYKLNNSMEIIEEESSSSQRISANQAILQQEEVIICEKRKHLRKHYGNLESVCETAEAENDEDWQPSAWEKHERKKKEITLNLPAKKIPSLLSSISTITKTSIRQELKITATLLNAAGADISETSQSIPTVYRQRKAAVTKTASEIRLNLKKSIDKFIIVHWDGKILQLMSGKTQDRLAVCISIPNENPGQFLASAEIASGSGKNMADAVLKILEEMHLLDQVQTVVFDTTASNSGQWKGSVTLFEELVRHVLLWLACRYHIEELHIKHASEEVKDQTIPYSNVLRRNLVFWIFLVEKCGSGLLEAGDVKKQIKYYNGVTE